MDILKEHLWREKPSYKTGTHLFNTEEPCESITETEVKKKEGKTVKECLDQEF